MAQTFNLITVWRESGYALFRQPLVDDGTISTRIEALRQPVDAAFSGDFSKLPSLVEHFSKAEPGSTTRICAEILGDCAPAALLRSLLLELARHDRFEPAAMICGVLARGSRLADAPILFHAFELYRDHQDRDVFWSCLYGLLGDIPPPARTESFEEFREIVSRRYHQLCGRYKTNCVYVHEGEPFDVLQLIKDVLVQLRSTSIGVMPKFQVIEANTGISREGFYRDGELQPLKIAAVLEEFLESSDLTQFCAGKRYFFGQPLEPATPVADESDSNGIEGFLYSLDTEDTFRMDDLPWASGGYFEVLSPFQVRMPHEPSASPWMSLGITLREAKLGNVKFLPILFDILVTSGDDEFMEVASEVLADAAPRKLLSLWREHLERNNDPQRNFHFCCGLLRRGYLSDVPFVLRAYQKNRDNDDFHYLQILLNELFWFAPSYSVLRDEPVHLGSGPYIEGFPFTSVDECCAEISALCETLAAQLGGDDIPIFRNKLFSVSSVASQILDIEEPNKLCVHLRYRFEASTGIDCTSFYRITTKGPVPQLSAAKAIAQALLESPAAAKFESGRRYFFGHLID